jgi:chlorophyllide a reductase subunit X
VARLSNDLGLYITDVSIDPKKGLIFTIDGNITICFGDDQDRERESKIAVLDALQESGEPYHYIDVRNPASPYYR